VEKNETVLVADSLTLALYPMSERGFNECFIYFKLDYRVELGALVAIFYGYLL
jgi:hypothetical protein